jgi:hypothetical protein
MPKLQEHADARKRIVIGCPKFEDARAYAQKLGEILKQNNISRVTVAHMEVPSLFCSYSLEIVWTLSQ